ncbi:MAG: tRNA preQ1(34) S-adenosylmethionine ribosyltransferase-isomerase QueA [Desulfobacteraceae bacterium IS3]|nr:MAG: tRNA preQ1(34) S-adenosylmethionine ribosyltransferase-isomerase QueA [Desulfobacteraceae bacterium IS3]
MFSLTDYSYHLPEERIAQQPLAERDQSKLLCLNRESGSLSHHKFCEICDMLLPSDVLVINNTEVIPGRLFGKKESGGKAEVLILDYGNGAKKSGTCNCLIKASKGLKNGSQIFFEDGTSAEIIDFHEGIHTVKFSCGGDFDDMLYRIGKVPLPPYIRRNQGENTPCDDKTAYQTVYASQKGAIAAPTAGLHFSASLIEKIKSKGVKVVAITLHVGYGTFLPVRVSDIREHRMHSERYSISETSAEVINSAKAEGRRVIAVGTTCVRTLEYASDAKGNFSMGSGECDLFIYPGYRFSVADAMITNFHLPESTLLMLVSAFAGREKILNAYKEAIEKEYRFYSYGDAMFIS